MLINKLWSHEEIFDKMVAATGKMLIQGYAQKSQTFDIELSQLVLPCCFSPSGQITPLRQMRDLGQVKFVIVLPGETRFLPKGLQDKIGHVMHYRANTSYFIFESNWPDWLLGLIYDSALFSWQAGKQVREAFTERNARFCMHGYRALEIERSSRALSLLGGMEFLKRIELAVTSSPKMSFVLDRLINIQPSYRQIIMNSLPSDVTGDQKIWFDKRLEHVILYILKGDAEYFYLTSVTQHLAKSTDCLL